MLHELFDIAAGLGNTGTTTLKQAHYDLVRDVISPKGKRIKGVAAYTVDCGALKDALKALKSELPDESDLDDDGDDAPTETPLVELGLPENIAKALDDAEITSVEQLAALDKHTTIKGIGEASAEVIQEALAAHNGE